MRKGTLAVISGFSGAGKGTLIRRLLEKYDDYVLSVSATTRDPREGEKEGVDYFYKTEEEFLAMIEAGAFLEHAHYVRHYYGTPLSYVDEQLAMGKNVLLEIEIQGALQVKEKKPDAVLLFITPPSVAELESRLIGRATESGPDIRERMRQATVEAEVMTAYDYIVINDDLEMAVEDIHAILRAQSQRASLCGDFIEKIKNELQEREETES